jgi:hypothetical protein
MKKHRLYEIDLEHKIAFCSVCRYTDIEVQKRRTGKVVILCTARAKEIREKCQSRKKQLPEDISKLENRPWHSLTDINPQTLMANCAICGPTDVIRVKERGKTCYRCATRVRDYRRQREHPHFFGRKSKLHPLSNIDLENGTAVCERCGPVKLYRDPRRDNQVPGGRPALTLRAREEERIRVEENTRIVNEYKRRHTCKRCGELGVEPKDFKFFEPHLPYAQRITTLIRTADPEFLRAEFEKRGMYCSHCHRLCLREFSQGIPVPPFKPLSVLL